MKRKILAGSTSVIERIFLRDTSVTTKVTGLTGITSATSGLTMYYARAGVGSSVAITLAAGTLGTWSSGGIVAVDATNMPGWYELGIPNAAVAAGAKSVGFHIRGATNMEDVPFQFELDGVDYQDGTRFGLSALPNAAAGASGGLATIDASLQTLAKVNAYSASQDPATFILVTPANKLGVDANNRVDLGKWLGQAVTLDANNVPNTNVKDYGGTAVTTLPMAPGAVTVATNNDKTGYTVSTVSDKTGYSLSASQTFNVTGNLSGSVGSVTGNVGGNVAGSVGSVLATVAANILTVQGATATGLANFNALGVDAGGNVFLSVGSLGLNQINASLAEVLFDFRVYSTGVTSPVTAGTYVVSGTYGGALVFYNAAQGRFLWLNGTVWTLNSNVGNIGGVGLSGFKTAAGAPITGPYTAISSETGTPVVTQLGQASATGALPLSATAAANAVLDAPQTNHLLAGTIGLNIQAGTNTGSGGGGGGGSTTLIQISELPGETIQIG